SAFWLPRFPSRFSSANNHLVAELAGEFVLAHALGRRHAGAWEHLLAELDKQILPDGAGAEQTPTYAAFTAELVLVAALVARDAGVDLPAASKERLMALAHFIDWIGPGASFGDNDEGQVLTSAHEADYPASVASAIVGFTGGVPVGEPADDFRALLLGAPMQSAAAPSGLMTFPNGGLSVWRGAIDGHQVNLRFDHGPLGYLSIAAHGHADALSVCLDIDGQQVLVDPGTYLYGSGGPWRSWFRTTPAHNTLNIAGQSQSIMSGAFNWSHKAQAHLRSSSASADWSLSAEHDGYLRRFGVTHQRAVRRDANTIAVQDRLIGPARDAEIVFQLAPELTAQADGNVVLVSRAGVPLLSIALPSADFTVAAGGDTPGQGGWVSTRFGIKAPAARIAWQGPVDSSGVLSRLTLLGH
ncbi:MAG: heparinase II/III family protein, partial [Alphaproteobacteria bacterium]|nr:heparinase II/III family protein [Alphaproteobacteria bacterium]